MHTLKALAGKAFTAIMLQDLDFSKEVRSMCIRMNLFVDLLINPESVVDIITDCNVAITHSLADYQFDSNK